MFNPPEEYCCATCTHSYKQKRSSIVVDMAELFPVRDMLMCKFYEESLKSFSSGGNVAVQAVLVRPDGYCEHYDTDGEKFMTIHGVSAEQSERVNP